MKKNCYLVYVFLIFITVNVILDLQRDDPGPAEPIFGLLRPQRGRQRRDSGGGHH